MDFSLSDLWEVTFRAVISLLTLFIIAKIIGKRQVSQLSLFDYVIGISIGNFAAEMTINFDSNELVGIIAVVIFGIIASSVSYLTLKIKRVRRFFTGGPTVIIDEGKIIGENLRKVKFDLDDLMEVCRSKGYFDISQIYYAVMESNGSVSFLPKVNYRPLTVEDMNLIKKQESLVANILMDGKIISTNLEKMNKTEKWLMHELKVNGYKKEDLLLVTLDIEDKLNFFPKKINKKINNIIE